MEKFKKRLRCEIVTGAVFLFLLVLAQVLVWSVLPESPNGVSKSFTSGFLTGISAVCIMYMVKNASTLKDDEKLKKLYIEENDERMNSIRSVASKLSFKVTLIGLSIAMLIAINLDKSIGYALLGALLFCIAVNLVTLLYYKRKM